MKLPGWQPSTSTAMPRSTPVLRAAPAQVRPAIRNTNIHLNDPQGEANKVLASASTVNALIKFGGDIADTYAKSRQADDIFQSELASNEYQRRTARWTAQAKIQGDVEDPDTGRPLFESYDDASQSAFDVIRDEVLQEYPFRSTEAQQRFHLNTANTDRIYSTQLFEHGEILRVDRGYKAFVNALETANSHVEIDNLVGAALAGGYVDETGIPELVNPAKARLDFQQMYRFAQEPSTPTEVLTAFMQEAADLDSGILANFTAAQRKALYTESSRQLENTHVSNMRDNFGTNDLPSAFSYLKEFSEGDAKTLKLPDDGVHYDKILNALRTEYSRLQTYAANLDAGIETSARSTFLTASILSDPALSAVNVNATAKEYKALDTQLLEDYANVPSDQFFQGQVVTEIDEAGQPLEVDNGLMNARVNLARIDRVPEVDKMRFRQELLSGDSNRVVSAAHKLQSFENTYPDAFKQYPEETRNIAYAVQELSLAGMNVVDEEGKLAYEVVQLANMPSVDKQDREQRYRTRNSAAPVDDVLKELLSADDTIGADDISEAGEEFTRVFERVREAQFMLNPDSPEVVDAVAYKLTRAQFKEHGLYIDKHPRLSGGQKSFLSALSLAQEAGDSGREIDPLRRLSAFFTDKKLERDSPFKYLPGMSEDYAWWQLNDAINQVNTARAEYDERPIKQSEVKLRWIKGGGEQASFVLEHDDLARRGTPVINPATGNPMVLVMGVEDPVRAAEAKQLQAKEQATKTNLVQDTKIANSGVQLERPFESHLFGAVVSTQEKLTARGTTVTYEAGRWSEETRAEETAVFTRTFELLREINSDRTNIPQEQLDTEIMRWMYDNGYKRFDHAGNEIEDPTIQHVPIIHITNGKKYAVPTLNDKWIKNTMRRIKNPDMQHMMTADPGTIPPFTLEIGQVPESGTYAVWPKNLGDEAGVSFDEAVSSGMIVQFNTPQEAEYFANQRAPEDAEKDMLQGSSGSAISINPNASAADKKRAQDKQQQIIEAQGNAPLPPAARRKMQIQMEQGTPLTDTSNVNSMPGRMNKQSIKKVIEDTAVHYGVDPKLALAVAAVESNYDANAESPVGAQGVFQLMPGTAKDLGVQDPFDPESNIDGGIRYLKELIGVFDGNIKAALMAYNWGRGNLKRKGASRAPKETRDYVKKIFARI